MLITCGTQPFAQRVAKKWKRKLEFHFATYEELPGPLLVGRYYQIQSVDHVTYSYTILNLCLDKKIDYVLPLSYDEAVELQKVSVLFEEYGIKILSPIFHLPSRLIHSQDLTRDSVLDIVVDGYSMISKKVVTSGGISGLVIRAGAGQISYVLL